ncbi:MAG: hypothetical protein M0Q48_00780 [Verrucomicrobia bacterium]|nr:hypothetical protein [Verrucomicrobiota bacterium]
MTRIRYWTKIVLGFAAAVLVAAASASAADLLLDFQFNEGEGLTSQSSVGDVTVSLGTEIDPAWTPTGVEEAPSGLPNDRAALFDGNGWLYGEYSAEPIDLTQPLTWEGWIYVDKDSTKGIQDYFNLGDTLKIGVDSTNQFQLTFRAVENVYTANIVVKANEISGSYWTHLACSWDPTGGYTPEMGMVRFYRDGIIMDEIETANQFRPYQANVLSVGAANNGGSLFQGMMDRVRLHKAALTADQLDSDAANPKPITANTVIAYEFNEETVPFLSATSPALPLESGTEKMGDVRQVSFSESTPPRDIDPSITDDFSVYVDNAGVTDYARKYGYFKTDTIDFGDQTDPSFSMEAWFKGLSKSSVKQVFFQLWSSPEAKCPRIAFAISVDFTVYLTTMGIADIETGVKIPEDGGWHHIACAYDHPAGVIYVYLDGKLGGTVNYNSGVNFATQTDGANSYTPDVDDSNCGMIGAEHTGYAPFSGYVDRLRFYKGVLAQADLDYEYYGDPIIAPIVATQPSSFKVPTDTKVAFNAKIVGTGVGTAPLDLKFPMSYQWYKDGVAIEGATKAILEVVATEATLGNYKLTATNEAGSITTNEGTLSLEETPFNSEMILDYQFNEGEGYVADSSVGGAAAQVSFGEAYSADFHPQSSDETPSGIVGDKSVSFGGIGWLMGYTTELYDLTQPLTVETWLYIDPLNDKTYEGFFTYGNTIKLGCDNNHNLVFTMYGVVDVVSQIMPYPGQWTHVAAVWEPGVGVKFYENGILMDDIAETGAAGAPLAEGDDANLYRITVGSESTGNPTWGKLDRTRLHRGLLAPDDLDSDPSNPKPTTANTLLSFDFSEDGMPYSSSIAPVAVLDQDGGEIAAADKVVQWSTDNPLSKVGDYSTYFNGSAFGTIAHDYVQLNQDDPSFTIETWVKGEPQTGRKILFANYGMGRFSFSINTDYSVFATTYGVADNASSARIPRDGKWHHIAFTLNKAASMIYFFVDGALWDQRAYTGTVNFNAENTESAYLAKESSGSNYVGYMDRFRLHKGALHPSKLDFYNVALAVPPVIESVTVPMVEAGQSAELSVDVSGTPPFSYQWYRNGTAVEGATEATYTIESADLANAGLFTVQVSNNEGGVTSDPIPLVVTGNPESFVKLLDFQLDEGSGLVTSSQVSGAIANFGIDPIPGAIAAGAAPSELLGDFSVDFTGTGWLYAETEEDVLDLNAPFTWEAWVCKSASDKTYEDFMRLGNTVKIGMNTAKVFQATFMGVVDINSTITVEDGVWTHLAAVWEPGVGVTFYKNGVQQGVTATTGKPNPYANNTVSLGGDAAGGSLYQGMMDRVRLHKAILTADELDSEAANPKPVTENTVLDYGFNEMVPPYNSVGEMPLQVVNGQERAANLSKPTWSGLDPWQSAENVGGNSLYFSGASYTPFNTDGVNFGDTTDSSFTMEAWIKDFAVKTTKQVFFQTLGNMAGTCPRLSFAVSATDAVSGNRTVFLTTLGVADINTGVVIPNDADWHHIAVAYNVPAGIIYVYIDGQLDGIRQQAGGPNFNAQVDDLRGCLGRELGGSSPTTGTVDRVRLWKGVLSPAQLDVPPAEPLPPLPTAELTWEVVDGELVLEWTGGTLEVSDTADAGWVAIDQASPLVVPLSEVTGSKFYRLAQ